MIPKIHKIKLKNRTFLCYMYITYNISTTPSRHARRPLLPDRRISLFRGKPDSARYHEDDLSVGGREANEGGGEEEACGGKGSKEGGSRDCRGVSRGDHRRFDVLRQRRR